MNTFQSILEEELINELIQVGFYDKISEGKVMVDIGEEMTHIPLILDGAVKILRKEETGEELLIYFLEPGDTCAISFINCINRKKSIFKAVSVVETEAFFVPVQYIDHWLANYQSWRHFIIDSYHFRLLEMVESIDGLAFKNLNQRVLKYLKDKAQVLKTMDLEITHSEIANDLNTSRVVITRLVNQLQEEGKIYSTRNRIKILEL